MSLDDQQARERVAGLEALLGELQGLAEPARSRALAAVAGLAEIYGEGLRRMLAEIPAAAAQRLGRDELVGHLLLMHDLHPLDVATRVREALAELRDNGAAVELVSLDSGTARVRLDTSRDGCGPSAGDVEAAIHGVIRAAAPEVESVEIDGAGAGVPLPMVVPARPARNAGVALPMASAAPSNGVAR